jgi:hypothetical protein
MRRIVERFLIAACAGLAACSSATEAGVPPVDILVNVDRTVVSPNSPVNVTISITNRGTEDVRVFDPRDYGCFAPYTVADRFGSAMELPGRACFLVAYPNVMIAPGATMTLVDRWTGYRANGDKSPVPASPGEYRFAARVFVDGAFRSSAGPTIVVQ